MRYTEDEIRQYVIEEDVKFLRLAFCDVYGKQKNISIQPDELERAFEYGIAFDASAVPGFGSEIHSDLFLQPDTGTLCVLPWRPDHGRVVRMFCNILHPDGTPFASDTRRVLQNAVDAAAERGISFSFGSEMEFYLFQRTRTAKRPRPYDRAGYMDIAPEDKGENIRREICLTLSQMGIRPECSHHEQGPGQNEIDFRYSDPMAAADNALTFRAVVNTIAVQSGLAPTSRQSRCPGQPGNGMHINHLGPQPRRTRRDAAGDRGHSGPHRRDDGLLQHDRGVLSALRQQQGSALHLVVEREPVALIRIPAAKGR